MNFKPGDLAVIVKRIKSYFHRHDWRGMEWNEWMQNGGIGTPDYICMKCGERRWWSQI